MTERCSALRAAALFALLVLFVGPAQALNIVHRAGTDDATTLDPHKVGYPGETTIMSDLFVGLTTLDILAKPIPGAAQSWSVSADGRTWTFQMRRGQRWSDGSRLTAFDFEFSLRRALAPATAFPYAGRLYMIRNARAVNAGRMPVTTLGVRAPDAGTLIIELENPAPYLPEVLASFAMPVPRAVVERRGDAWTRPQWLVNNGPFLLQEWRPNAYIRLRRNPQFYDAANVPADEVMHYPVTAATTAMRRYAAGEIDFVLTFPPDQMQRARAEFGSQVKVDQALGVEVLAFNNRRGVTRDPRVRRALSLALDRETLARNVLSDARLAAYSYVAPGAANYPVAVRADFAGWTAERRRGEARRLLEEAGFGADRPLRLRLAFPANDINRRVAVVVDAMWRSVGVRAELVAKEQRALSADVAGGDFDAVRTLWLAGHSDALGFLERLDGAAAGTTMNQSGYANARYDALLAQAQAEPDIAKRAALLRSAEALALAEQPVAPIFYFVGRRLVSPRLRGWQHNPRGIHVSRWMSVPAR